MLFIDTHLLGENCLLTPPTVLWQCWAMLGESENQFSLTRAALGTSRGAESNCLSAL